VVFLRRRAGLVVRPFIATARNGFGCIEREIISLPSIPSEREEFGLVHHIELASLTFNFLYYFHFWSSLG
jgi:hypothetical protein